MYFCNFTTLLFLLHNSASGYVRICIWVNSGTILVNSYDRRWQFACDQDKTLQHFKHTLADCRLRPRTVCMYDVCVYRTYSIHCNLLDSRIYRTLTIVAGNCNHDATNLSHHGPPANYQNVPPLVMLAFAEERFSNPNKTSAPPCWQWQCQCQWLSLTVSHPLLTDTVTDTNTSDTVSLSTAK